TPSKSARTWSSSETSHLTKSPPASARSTRTTCAPSDSKRRTVAAPIPLAAPVTTATRPSNRRNSILRTQEDVLGFRERQRGIGPKLTSQSALFDPAERSPVPHRRMGVHTEHSRLHG